MVKQIEYRGETFIVNSNGEIIWRNSVRKHHINDDGYPRISFKTEKGWTTAFVHKLIALAFVPNPNNYPEVDHINFNKKDYSIDNLQWVSRIENVRRSLPNWPDKHGENNSNYGNRKLSQFYKEHPEVAKEKQSRPGKQNGRYKHGRYMSVKV